MSSGRAGAAGPDLSTGEPPVDPLAVDRWRRVQRLAHLMDTAVQVPGTQRRIGADGLLGLIPGVGDAATLAVSGLVVAEGIMLGARGATVVRMLLNVLVDALIGAVPVLGWFGDFAFKANSRNVALLKSHSLDPTRTRAESRRAVVITVVALIAIGALVTVLAVALIAWLVSLAV